MCRRKIEGVAMDTRSTLRIFLNRYDSKDEYEKLTQKPVIKSYRTEYIRTT
jgi:hypothetical protein